MNKGQRETMFLSRKEKRNMEGELKPIVIDSWKTKILAISLFILLITLMFNVNFRADKTLDYFIGSFATISFIYLLVKILLSFFYKPAADEPKHNYRVSVVMPSYNENAESVFKSVQCLLQQDYPIHEIIFVDDGSKDITAYNEINRLKNELETTQKEVAASIEGTASHMPATKIITHRFKQNKGKKEAQAWGFKRATGDVIMLADSDGYIFPNATRELLKAFNDKKVTSVVGHINPRNVKETFLTRMQDILYHNAFRVGRGAQSVTGTVLVCSGALSMHKREFVVNNIDEFLKSTFMGLKCESGDDRKLTNLSLKTGGKTKYQSTAQCITDVPVNSKSFFKQQVRWSKSFYVQTLEALTFAWKKPFMFMWLVAEGFIWLLFAVSQTISLIYWTDEFYLILFIFAVGYFVLSAMVSGIYYAMRNPLRYILLPFFALAQLLFLFPIRAYALLTLNKTSWGTR